MKKQATIVVDLSFGDAGKGSIVDYLVRRDNAKTVVRFNGGAQAAHNVVTPNGRHHTFSQFGSGTFVSGVKTYLSKFVLVNPIALLEEGRSLISKGETDVFSRMMVDEKALVTTPFHWVANRLKEMARGDARHGSCGKGIGETMADFLAYGEEMLRIGDLLDRKRTKEKLTKHQELKIQELRMVVDKLPKTEAVERELDILFGEDVVDLICNFYDKFVENVQICRDEVLQKILLEEENVIFEGAQGALLDEWYGFHPYTTWSTTRDANARELLEDYQGSIKTIGLLRAYASRHGAGPFVTEIPKLAKLIPDIHNETNDWQNHFRIGWQDLVSLDYAINISYQVDELAVTCLDRFEELTDWKVARAYKLGQADARFFSLNSDQEIVGIKLKSSLEDLDYQGELTKQLDKVEPIWVRPYSKPQKKFLQFTSWCMAGYLSFLEENLQLPITVISEGTKATDKTSIENTNTIQDEFAKVKKLCI